MRDLTKGNIYKSFILFAVPLILSGVLSQAYSILDTVIAGKFLGQDGIAAIGATSHAISLISSVFWGFGGGLGIYIAKLFGAKDFRKLKSDIYNVVLILLAALLLCSLLLLIFRNGLLELLNVEASIRKDAEIYFCIYMAGFFTIILSNTFSHIMNALGASSFPFYMSLISAVLNILGNILSVTVLDLGITGIALASVLAAVVVDLCYMIKIKSCLKELGVDRQEYRLDLSSIRHVVRYGGPVALQQTAMYISAFLISPIVNGFGAAATASYTVVMRIYNINASIYQSSSKTLSNYAAQCVGAGKYDKIRKGLFVGLLQSVIFVFPVVLCCSIFAKPVCALFFPSGYAGEALDYAVLFARVYLPFILLNLINNLFHSFFRGIAAMRFLIVATVLGSVIRFIASFAFSSLWGLEGVYIGWAVSWLAEALFMLAVYLLKFRTTPMLQRFIEQE